MYVNNSGKKITKKSSAKEFDNETEKDRPWSDMNKM